MWPVGLDVAEQALDPGLVGRRARPAEVRRDRADHHELPRRPGGRHLRPVVADGQQDRPANIITERAGGDGRCVLARLEEPQQSVEIQGIGERDLHLGAGLLPENKPVCS